MRGPVGALDTGFGVGGVVSLGQASDASGLVVDAGKITLGGRIGGDLAVVRLNEDGALDVNYAVGGILRTNVGTLLSTQEMITSFGGLVLGATIDSGTTPRAILVAITPTGALKTNFGLSGIAPVPLVLGTTLAASPLLGRFLVGGRTTLTSPNGSVVLLKDDGSPLTTFGSNGVLEGPNDCPGVNKSDCFTRAVTVDKSNFYVCAFRHDGSLVSESSVGGGSTLFGTVYTSLSIDTCTSLAVDAAGQKIYVGGDWVGAAAVSRYKPDGSLDDTWAMGSVAGAPAGSNLTQARRIMLQADGSLIVASNATVGGLGAFAVWRLLPDGSTDKSFAPPSGFATKTVASTNVVVKAMAVDADGRIVIAGGNGEMVVTRFWQ